jgi:hypothetical protein
MARYSPYQPIYLQGVIINDVRRYNVLAFFIKYISNDMAMIELNGIRIRVPLTRISEDYIR